MSRIGRSPEMACGHSPGCPPTPEALYYGILQLQERIIRYDTMARKRGTDAAEQQRIADRQSAMAGLRA